MAPALSGDKRPVAILPGRQDVLGVRVRRLRLAAAPAGAAAAAPAETAGQPVQQRRPAGGGAVWGVEGGLRARGE